MGTSRASTRFVDLDTVGLLALVRSGDNEAFGELFVRYEGFAHKVARRASRRHADDLVSESFRRILTAISRGAGPTQAFGPYLAATIRSAAAGLAAPYQEVELDVSQLIDEESGEVDPRVSTAFIALPEAWQNALWYSDVEGMSPRHAAPLMGLPSANAFSALRQRARAGLRSAYLTEVVDSACNEAVRERLQLLIAGKTTPEELDALVDEHIEHCDECAAIAWRVAAVSGSKLGLVLAPAMLGFHGFTTSGSLLPVGLGLTGVWGWFRRLPSQAAAAVVVAVMAATGLMVTGVLAATGGASESSASSSTSVAQGDASGSGVPATGSPSAPGDDSVTDTPTTSSTTTSSSTTSVVPTTTSLVPPFSPVPIVVTTSTSAPTTVPRRPITTTLPATTIPATTTTTIPTTTTTTIPPTTTTTTIPPTTTTTTIPTTTTTTTTTTIPTTTTTTTTVPEPPGALSIISDTMIGAGNGAKRRLEIQIIDMTGAPGSLTFSTAIQVMSVENLVCVDTTCTFSGTTAPDFAAVLVQVDVGPLTVQLLDADGVVVDSYS